MGSGGGGDWIEAVTGGVMIGGDANGGEVNGGEVTGGEATDSTRAAVGAGSCD
jgi:hypothetical protein